jgi:hypothetical protein
MLKTSILSFGLVCVFFVSASAADHNETERRAASSGPLFEQLEKAISASAVCDGDKLLLQQDLAAMSRELSDAKKQLMDAKNEIEKMKLP